MRPYHRRRPDGAPGARRTQPGTTVPKLAAINISIRNRARALSAHLLLGEPSCRSEAAILRRSPLYSRLASRRSQRKHNNEPKTARF